MNTREVHGGQRLAVDFRIGNQDALGHQRLVLLLEVNVDLRTDEGHDGLVVSLGTDNEHLVAYVEYRLAVRNGQFAVVNNARYHEVAVQEVVYLQQGLALQVLVRNLKVHFVRLLVGAGLVHGLQQSLVLL